MGASSSPLRPPCTTYERSEGLPYWELLCAPAALPQDASPYFVSLTFTLPTLAFHFLPYTALGALTQSRLTVHPIVGMGRIAIRATVWYGDVWAIYMYAGRHQWKVSLISGLAE